jgi:uncharacterized protein involved in outer membrane biogenesis
MKLWQKLSLAILAVLILSIISVSFLVKSRITSEIIETLVIPQLEEITKHTISFSTLEVGWQGTITVKNLSMSKPTMPGGAVVLQSKDLVLHCRLLPLLSRKIIIEELTLHQPQIKLTRDKEGNYTLLQDKPETSNKVSDTDKASLDTTLSLTITHLNIKEGAFIFTDHSKTSSSPFQFTLKRINLHASDISPVSSFPVDLSAETVSDRPSFINLNALVNPLRKEMESKVKLSPLDITQFAPYFPEFPFTIQQGYSSLDLTLTANRSLEFNSNGLLSLTNLSLSTLSTPDGELSDTFVENLQNITIDLDHHLSYKPSEDTIVLEKLNATLQKIRLSLEGKIKTFTTNPLYDVTIKTENLAFQDMLDSVPRGLMPGGENLIASGTTGAHLSIKGSLKKPEDLELNGALLIDKLTVQSKQTPSCKTRIDAKISLNSHEITIERFEATLQDSPLTLEGRIHDYLKGPLTAEFQLTSPSLHLDNLISCLEERGERGFPEEEETEKSDEKGPFNFDHAKIRANISFDSVNYKNIHASDVKAMCRLDDNVLHLESLEGKIGNGSLNLKSRVDLAVEGLDYTLQFTGNDLELNSILTSLAPDVQEDIQGVVSFTSDFQGKGTTSDTFKKNLKGKGSIDINAATVANLKSLKSLSSFIKLDKLDTLRFDQSHGTFQIADGLAHTQNTLKGNEIELYPEGTISLDAVLDLILEMRLAPSLSEQIANEALTKYFKDERGWTVISLAIKGPADEVVIVPASSTIKNISEMLIDILLKKEDVDSDKRQDKKKALEDLLKGLIKKSKEAKPE